MALDLKQVTGHVVVAVLGAGALFLTSGALRARLAAVGDRFVSGDWAVYGPNEEIDQRLQATLDREEGVGIALAPASIARYSLTGANRRETVGRIGRATLRDGTRVELFPERLISDYGALLIEARDDPNIKPEMTAKAFDSYRKGVHTPGEAFVVDTTPHSESYEAWDNEVPILPMAGRCDALVSRNDILTEPGVRANIRVFPRVREVVFDRPWLNSTFLDVASRSTRPQTLAFFAANGGLRAVPESIWVTMPERVEFDTNDAISDQRVAQWTSSRKCCVLTCDGRTMAIASPTFDQAGRQWVSTRADVEPELYAVTYRRRALVRPR